MLKNLPNTIVCLLDRNQRSASQIEAIDRHTLSFRIAQGEGPLVDCTAERRQELVTGIAGRNLTIDMLCKLESRAW
jgi:hypothetical protein